jgi:uncharacterized membrane protein YeiB
MKQRIIGFDLARAYAILGMYIVNFNIVFGSHQDQSILGQFLNLFNGNSSTIFVILAGMGLALMTNRPSYLPEEKQKLRAIVIKRSWFLFVMGLLLYQWWPADILHFYGGYMHFAAFWLFLPKKYYLYLALGVILIFHLLLGVIPYETGWNFETLIYQDFWTLQGFVRNTFYNGWNAIFPWLAFFLLGLYLGRLDWQNPLLRKNLLWIGLSVFLIVQILQGLAMQNYFSEELKFYITADYIPPFLVFMLGTSSISLVILVLCVYVGDKFATSNWIKLFTQTGQLTLTHYLSHLTIGMIIFAWLSGKTFEAKLNESATINPFFILLYAIAFYGLSIWFSHWYRQKSNNGPLETIMRKISG